MSKYIKLEDIETLITACEWRMTLAKERHGEGFVDYSKQVFDVDELTKRLSDLPTIEVSEDCISREWVKGICEMMLDEEMLGHMLGYIEDAPSVTTEQTSMVGEWKKEVNEKLGKCLRVVYVCSACGCAVGCESFLRRSYCPNCGAKMKG